MMTINERFKDVVSGSITVPQGWIPTLWNFLSAITELYDSFGKRIRIWEIKTDRKIDSDTNFVNISWVDPNSLMLQLEMELRANLETICPRCGEKGIHDCITGSC